MDSFWPRFPEMENYLLRKELSQPVDRSAEDIEQGLKPLFTTTWVAYEALSLIKSRMGYKKTLELWEVLNNRRLVKLVRVSRIMEEAELKKFFDYQDKS